MLTRYTILAVLTVLALSCTLQRGTTPPNPPAGGGVEDLNNRIDVHVKRIEMVNLELAEVKERLDLLGKQIDTLTARLDAVQAGQAGQTAPVPGNEPEGGMDPYAADTAQGQDAGAVDQQPATEPPTQAPPPQANDGQPAPGKNQDPYDFNESDFQ